MDFRMMHPADQIVTIMNRLYYYGMTTTTGGNLSVRDGDGTVWISPSGVDKGSLRREDIVRITPEGEIVGHHKPSVEYPFHLAIYRHRPDLRAVLHAHPPALVAFSIVRKIPDTTIYPDAHRLCGKIEYATYACPGSSRLGENIAARFAAGVNTVMLENHGVVIGSDSLFSAFMSFEALDYCARLETNARTVGTPVGISEKDIAFYYNKVTAPLDEFIQTEYSSEERSLRRDMCALIVRAYENRLFTSDQGTFSCRLDDGSFVITPHAKDRKYLEPEDLVHVKAGMAEAGKIPSRAHKLHEQIYRLHPDVKTIINAHPPHIMAFAVTHTDFDARLIPESYIALREILRCPIEETHLYQERLAQKLSLSTPVAMVENDCVIALGTSLLNAFDRLEVIEYSAKSVIEASRLGEKIVPISDAEVSELKAAFSLQ
ncbi:MAG: class II aldolase/adducin family protein [Clostridia bacterium]|nr:class II aldolase/adducin family protein [Clostridia bacterium]